MTNSKIFSKTGNFYYHYNLIGTGLIFSYAKHSKQVIISCEFTGNILEIKDFYNSGGFTKESFKKSCEIIYQEIAEDGFTVNLDFLEDYKKVGIVKVDFDLLLN